MSKVRVRYAPSPTGLLHIGNARSALFNYLFARHFDGDFIVRIEDTDTLRNVEGGEESQLKYLSWLGLSWDESPDKGGKFAPYRQLERLDLYTKYANELLEKGLAYKDYREDSDKFAIRFKVPKDVTYSFNDMVRGTLQFESKEVEDWIIMKDNGIPTYNFAVVVDDHLMEITHVLRGEEHITNTPKQIMVYQAFGWDVPQFGHMTIIVNENKKKLSKRDKNVIQFIGEYADLGYLPEAMFNFISLLGWSPQADKEILSKEELITLFDPKRLSKAPAMFDKEKLAFINSKYIKALPLETLVSMCKPYLEKENIQIVSEKWLNQLVSLFQDRMLYLSQITTFYKTFFHETFELDETLMQTLSEYPSEKVLKCFADAIEEIDFTSTNIETAIKQAGIDSEVKGKGLFMPIRIGTTAEAHGPSLPVSLELLGKERVLKRIKQTLILIKGEAK